MHSYEVFNFFNGKMSFEALCNHFELNHLDVNNFYLYNNDDYIESKFIKKFDLKLFNRETKHVKIKCKHITTSFDNLVSFKKNGLMRLDEVLEGDTALNHFLKQKGIEVILSERNFIFEGKKYYLFKYDEDCKFCSKDGCEHVKYDFFENIDLTHKNYFCEYRKNMIPLIIKLYSHKSEIEFHISGKREDIIRYSCVRTNPEILMTLDKVIKKTFGKSLNLEYSWKNTTNRKTYLLETDILAHSFEGIKDGKFFDGYELYRFLEACGIDKGDFEELLDEEKRNFFTNLYLIKKSFTLINGVREGFVQLLPNVKIGWNDIAVEEIDYI